jgi:hypothetical protein
MKSTTLRQGLADLERFGIRKRDDVSLEDILYSTGGSADDRIEYIHLLCTLGGEAERGAERPISNDLWHFDAECIEDDDSYVRIAERLAALSKGALALTEVSSCLDSDASVARLEFRFQGELIHWEFELQSDWVDGRVLSWTVDLFERVPSEARFTYADLGGQDCLIGFATLEQRRGLTELTGATFEWLK